MTAPKTPYSGRPAVVHVIVTRPPRRVRRRRAYAYADIALLVAILVVVSLMAF
jgi:hypothetical protein